MTSRAGVAKIARFNWPWYVAAMAVTAAAAVVIRSGVLPERSVPLAIAALLIADFWIIASLVISHYVYDLSPISRGGWLAGVEPAAVRRVAVFHAGQDEGSQAAIQRLPAATIETFDFYDPAGAGSPSLERARALANGRARAIAADRIPLDDGALDLGLVVFAAHEIRRAETRTAFFRELGRVVAPSGRVVVVEHLRDVWNFIAFGPGALHFQSRAAWSRSFASAGLTVLDERTCTPFVRVFELGRPS